MIEMNRITNKEIMEKLETLPSHIHTKEIIEKIDHLQTTVDTLQANLADKEAIRRLSAVNKKSVVMSYAVLSIAYLGIGLAILFSSIQLTTIFYGILFAVFFGGSLILAYLAIAKSRELQKMM
jgi:hypothetical protein